MKNKKYFQIALYVFLTFAACFLFYTAVVNGQTISNTLAFWGGLLSPFIVGFGIAYVVNFIMRFCEGLLGRIKPLKASKALRPLSLASAYLILLIALTLVVMLVVPQLVNSISSVVENYNAESMKAFFASVSDFFHRITGDNEFLSRQVDQRLLPLLDKLVEGVFSWVPQMLPGLMGVIGGITQGVSNFVMGFVISIYLLADKERLCARVKKLTVAFLNKERADKLIGFTHEMNETVRDFLSGKLLECLIMSLLTFLVLAVFGVEMPFLLGVILGISNLVPFIGPIVGMVVGGVLLLLVRPGEVIVYLIVSFLLLQVDGNLLGPKILGKSTGLDALWIVVAILLGGSLFGLWGMLLGVPFFAILYALLAKAVNRRLKNASLSADTEDYVDYRGTDIGLVGGPCEKESKKPSFLVRIWKRRKK